MKWKRILAALTALTICLSVTVQPALADYEAETEMAGAASSASVTEEEVRPEEIIPEEETAETPPAVTEAEEAEGNGEGEELPEEGKEIPEEEEGKAAADAPVVNEEEPAAEPNAEPKAEPNPEPNPEPNVELPVPAPLAETVMPNHTDEEQPAVRDASGLELNEINFPDPAFRDSLGQFDLDENGSLSPEEVAAVTDMTVRNAGIASLNGIAHFTGLTSLDASLNALTTLDLSSNTALETVVVNGNRLESITLPARGTMKVLNVSDNALTSLDVSNLSALTNLWADNNRLVSLNLSNCPLDKGRAFSVNDNYLTQITLPGSGMVDWESQLAGQRLPVDKQKGYQLKWYNDAEGKQPLQPEEGIIPCIGQTLYIKAEAIRYTLTFSAGGESVSGKTDGMDVVYDQTVSLPDCGFSPADPEREFAGWKLNGKVYQAQEQVKNLTDVDGSVLELVAQWRYRDYSGTEFTITLHDGDGKSEPFTANYGQTVAVTTGLTKDHHHLAGWSTSQGGSVWLKADKTISYDRPSQLTAALGQPAQLYAVWEKDRHTVSLAGVTPALHPITAEYGSTIRLPAAPYRTGYVFEGWYTDDGRLWNEDSDVVEQDMTLTARYRAARFTVKLDGNNADSGSMSERQVTYDQVQNLPQNEYTRQWYEFAGWAFTPEGTVMVADQADISRISITDGDTVTLYAVWNRKQTDVTVMVNGTEYRYRNDLGTVLDIPAPRRTGWKFLGWKDEQGSLWQENSLVTQALSLTAEFEPICYTVVFNGAGAENADAMKAATIELTYDRQTELPANLYTRPEHTFLGWSRTPGGRVEFADKASVGALTGKDGSVVTLYAVWQAPANKPVSTPSAGTDSSGTTPSPNAQHGSGSASGTGNHTNPVTVAVPTPQPVAVASETPVVSQEKAPFAAPERQNSAVSQGAEAARNDGEKPAPQENTPMTQEDTRKPQNDISGEGKEDNPVQENGVKPAWVRLLAFVLGALVLAGGGLFGAVYTLRWKKP